MAEEVVNTRRVRFSRTAPSVYFFSKESCHFVFLSSFFRHNTFSLLICPNANSVGHAPTDAVQAATVSGKVRDHYRFGSTGFEKSFSAAAMAFVSVSIPNTGKNTASSVSR